MEKQEREDFIESREEIIENIKTLYSYLEGVKGDTYKNWAVDIMKYGKNFVVEAIDSKICFCPSRFVGYKNNTKIKHDRSIKSGTKTDSHLSPFYNKVTDERLDDLLHDLLEKFGETNCSKKYWISKDTTVDELLQSAGKVQKHYWIGRVSDDNYWNKAIEGKFWLTQQRYNIQTSSAVTNLLQLVSQIKEGDVILLTFAKGIHAYGNVVKCATSSSSSSSSTRSALFIKTTIAGTPT